MTRVVVNRTTRPQASANGFSSAVGLWTDGTGKGGRVVWVDINPAVVTKLSDRGSQQTVGVVSCDPRAGMTRGAAR